MLRLGRKYEILAFKNDALARMHTEFPASLSNWRSPLANQNLATIEDRAGVYLDLLNLAYDQGLFTCIPTLGFKCLQLFTLVSTRGILRRFLLFLSYWTHQIPRKSYSKVLNVVVDPAVISRIRRR